MNRIDTGDDGAVSCGKFPVARVKALLRVLAASKLGAVAILIGEDTVGYGNAVLEGLDMCGRLIVNVPSGVGVEAIKTAFCTDIRVAVHAQASTAFLRDVRHHRFDLIVVDSRLLDDELGARILEVTPVGGFVVFVNTTDARLPHWSAQCFDVSVGQDCTLAVKLAENHRPVRRGGRRGRRS